MEGDQLLGGRYRRLRPLGSGDVWVGEDTLLERRVALRPLPAAEPDVDRVLRDVKRAARLTHPHAVAVHDLVVEDGQPHLVTQFVEGYPLAERIGSHPLTDHEAEQLFAGVADALAAAHELGVLHGGITPSCVLVHRRGHALLADFAIAGGPDATTADDVYALGVTLYAALEGRPPFADGDSAPPPQRAGRLTGLVMAMLGPLPQARPSAADVAAALANRTTPAPQVPLPPPIHGAPPDPVDGLATLLAAIEHGVAVTDGSSGTVDDWETLVVGEIAPVLSDDDRVDLFVPTLFGLDDRHRAGLPRQVVRTLGELRSGVTVAMADRLVCAWITDDRTLAHISVTIEYATVRSVTPAVFNGPDAQYHGVDLDCGSFVWPVLFANDARLDTLRNLLTGRPTGAVQPQWDAGRVAAWLVPDGQGGGRPVRGWAEVQ